MKLSTSNPPITPNRLPARTQSAIATPSPKPMDRIDGTLLGALGGAAVTGGLTYALGNELLFSKEILSSNPTLMAVTVGSAAIGGLVGATAGYKHGTIGLFYGVGGFTLGTLVGGALGAGIGASFLGTVGSYAGAGMGALVGGSLGAEKGFAAAAKEQRRTEQFLAQYRD